MTEKPDNRDNTVLVADVEIPFEVGRYFFCESQTQGVQNPQSSNYHPECKWKILRGPQVQPVECGLGFDVGECRGILQIEIQNRNWIVSGGSDSGEPQWPWGRHQLFRKTSSRPIPLQPFHLSFSINLAPSKSWMKALYSPSWKAAGKCNQSAGFTHARTPERVLRN